jgi:hypothetical protein
MGPGWAEELAACQARIGVEERFGKGFDAGQDMQEE